MVQDAGEWRVRPTACFLLLCTMSHRQVGGAVPSSPLQTDPPHMLPSRFRPSVPAAWSFQQSQNLLPCCFWLLKYSPFCQCPRKVMGSKQPLRLSSQSSRPLGPVSSHLAGMQRDGAFSSPGPSTQMQNDVNLSCLPQLGYWR